MPCCYMMMMMRLLIHTHASEHNKMLVCIRLGCCYAGIYLTMFFRCQNVWRDARLLSCSNLNAYIYRRDWRVKGPSKKFRQKRSHSTIGKLINIALSKKLIQVYKMQKKIKKGIKIHLVETYFHIKKTI